MSLIKANNLSIAYKNNEIIKDSNFTINDGDFVFLTGISGSGKTSLIKSIYGEIKPRGELFLGPYNLAKINKSTLSKIRKRLGIVFQDYKLIPEWNILKNVMLPLIILGYDKKASQQKAIELLKKVKLSHKIDRFPAELSGGEQQRVAIARALIHNPALILADEPISGLDEFSASLVMDLFIMANKLGIAVLIASHSLPQDFNIQYRHLHIEKGKVYELS
ncbi:ATP-binding cassette domain-containing protein [Caminibacter mediatlanticus TB-2]|uniref:ATP-binding cassette domain-containing protein n=1 Tax=Caminibacter mediatlanticus TB-2 TaxID=391592 RepID=A0ABX5VA30_9BACT|nr:ATP-binding cassette domain-containing protein [Caminibacter mediatlanticus]QCT95118.1 ATP-binding cassette domain-containing protein [Caminibacter mediatlanticus TB-2]